MRKYVYTADDEYPDCGMVKRTKGNQRMFKR